MASFSAAILDAAVREREVALTTHGRTTGSPHRTVLWLWGDGQRLFVRSGGGLGRRRATCWPAPRASST